MLHPSLPARCAAWIFPSKLTTITIRKMVFIAELWQGDQLVSRQTAGFAPIKHLSLVNPEISVELSEDNDQLMIELTSRSLALLVELSLAGSEVVFSDNYFNLPAGRTSPDYLPNACRLDPWSESKNEFHVRSVYDSYSHG